MPATISTVTRERKKALRGAHPDGGDDAGSADEIRARLRAEHLTELAGCPGHAALQILSGKWLTLITEALGAGGPLGHADIARRVPGATQKMLTQTLRQLERDGFVTRTVIPTVPPTVDYELTDLGDELLRLQVQIRAWGQRFIPQVQEARQRHAASAVGDVR